jgi:DNA-binding HxlR family transcriptional regulator
MPAYGQFCPVAKGAEVFAERWTPLILRELMQGSHRFNELRLGLPLMSQSLLAQRLRSLERDEVIERRPAPRGRGWEYYLTPAGEEMRPLVEMLGAWGYRWAIDRLSREDCDPGVLVWYIHRHIHIESLPAERVVVQFEFRNERKAMWWLVLDRPQVEFCPQHPGFDNDLQVLADTRALVEVYLGHLELGEAMRQGLVEVEGPRRLVRAFPRWIGISKFVCYARPTSLPKAAAAILR